MNTLPIGTKIQSPTTTYIITGVLGTGGFGITYSATCNLVLGTLRVKVNVALKEHFLKADCQRDQTTKSVVYSQPAQDRVERSKKDFTGEARRLKSISGQHPNIVTVSEVFEANNTSYYAMEMLEGVTLKEYISARGPMNEQSMLEIMRPIVDAVAFLHKNRITHLDIKPQNIMIATDDDGRQRPVLIDFGLSKHYDESGDATSTINTQGYSDGFAPIEQYMGITTFSPASDVYSLAATMVFCLTGKKVPIANELYPETLEGELPQNISSGLRIALMRALSQRKDQRPKDGEALGKMLGENTNEQTLLYRPKPAGPPKNSEVAEVIVKKGKKNGWIIPVFIFGLIVAGVAVWLLGVGREDEPEYEPLTTDVVESEAQESEVVESSVESSEEDGALEAEVARKVEEALKAEEAKKAVETKKAEEAKKAEEVRNAEAAKKSWFLHSTPKNCDLCVTWEGKTGYISERDWQKMNSDEKGQCTKKGIYLSGDGQRFLLALNDSQSSEIDWNDAIAKYGNSLPTRDQGDIMGKNVYEMNSALRVYGGQQLGDWYWTRTESSSSYAWYVSMYLGTVLTNNKTSTSRVRAVAPVPVVSAM